MSERRPGALIGLVVLALPALVSCTGPGDRAEITRLAARVDSLAVTVEALKSAIQGGAQTAPPETATVTTTGAAVLGTESAPVTIVEFTDYQCPFCARHARGTLPGLKSEFIDRGRVRYVLRDMPLEQHPLAMPAAKAARCAGSQGAERYWPYHDALFEAQSHLAETTFVAIARRQGLELDPFEACLMSPGIAASVDRDAAGAAEAGLTGTPSFVIGRTAGGTVTGVVLRGAYPLARFREVIERTRP